MKEYLTLKFFAAIRWLNRTPNEHLSRLLHDASLDYAQRPGERCKQDAYARYIAALVWEKEEHV